MRSEIINYSFHTSKVKLAVPHKYYEQVTWSSRLSEATPNYTKKAAVYWLGFIATYWLHSPSEYNNSRYLGPHWRNTVLPNLSLVNPINENLGMILHISYTTPLIYIFSKTHKLSPDFGFHGIPHLKVKDKLLITTQVVEPEKMTLLIN